MQMVLGLVEGSWVDIGIALAFIAIPALGTFAYLKIKSKIMVDVKKEIDEEIAPLKKSMDGYERDIKELKKDELEPIKKRHQRY